MASIKERIKAALFSNVTQSVAWGLALFANTGLVAMGLVNKDVPGAITAMLGAIAAALMIFSILLREKAESEDEDEADTETADESESAANESETESKATSETAADTEESEDAESKTESEAASEESADTAESGSSTVGSAKSGEAIAAEGEA